MTGPDEALAAVERVIADYPRRLAEATERVETAAAAQVRGEDLGGLVTVTASGRGEILSVRVSERALSDLDARTLGVRVEEATNAALARAEALVAEAAGEPDTSPTYDAELRLRAYEQRMDDTLDRLDRIDRDLDRLLGD